MLAVLSTPNPATVSRIGIDKVKLWTPDFRVKDVGKAGLVLKPGAVDLDTGENRDVDLFRDSAGVRVRGKHAERNTDRYNLTVTGDGLTLSFNPSKPFHPFDLVSQDTVFRDRVEAVTNDLKERGIAADWLTAKLTRLDVSRNVLTNAPVTSYEAVWPYLKMKRQKYQTRYPSGYGTGNDQWGAVFYDKGAESGKYQGRDLLRGELQFKRARKVLAVVGCNTLDNIRQFGLKAIADTYRDHMTRTVFRDLDGGTQLGIDFQDETDVLTRLREANDRTAVAKYFYLLSVSTFVAKYPNPDTFADVLRAAGFGRMSIDRTLKALRHRLTLHDTVYGSKHPTVGKMLREVYYKIAS
jgi:hypothetical protein